MDQNLDNFESPIEKAEMLTVLSVGFLVLGEWQSRASVQTEVHGLFFVMLGKGETPQTDGIMSTKFFNNIETTLMDKFHGIATSMANFDIFHAVVGYFRSSGYIKL